MKLAKQYFRLRDFYRDAADGEEIETSLHDVAELLGCTNRNANLIVKKMAELQWISWTPGRGRGNLSLLAFLIRTEALQLEMAKELVRREEIRSAVELINREPVSASIKEEFNEWLNSHFGYHAETKAEKQIETLRFPMSNKFGTLDPAIVSLASESHMISQIFDRLVRYNPQTGSFEPQLAHSWESNEAKTEWTFYLRKGVLFHHGRELTAGDVVFSFWRIMDPALRSPFRWIFAKVKSIEVLGTLSLRIALKEPNHLFLHYLSAHPASIIPEDAFHKLGDHFNRLPVGTGPFRVARNDDAVMILEAFPTYFSGRAQLDQVEMWIIPNLDEIKSSKQLTNFQMRMKYFFPAEDVSSSWKEVERLEAGAKLLTFNLFNPGRPQRQLSFRKALQLAIDRNRLIAETGEDRLMPAYCLLPEQEQHAKKQGYDPVEAERLLKESGYNGEPLLLYTYGRHASDALLLQQQCRELGIHIEVCSLSASDLFAVERIREADLILFELVMDEDIVFSLLENFLLETSFIRCHLSPDLLMQVEQAIADFLKHPVESEHAAKLMELDKMLTREFAVMHLYRRKQLTYFHPALKGVSLSSFGLVHFKDLWFQPASMDKK